MTSISDFLDNSGVAQITVSAILGGIGFKVVEHFLNARTFVNEHTELRIELRKELDIMRAQVAELREEVDEWREKYFSQLTVANEVDSEMTRLHGEIQEYKMRFMTMNEDEPASRNDTVV